MNKEDFLKLGLSEEQATECEKASSEELKKYVPYERLKEVINEKNTLKQSLTERDTQLEDLKKAGSVEDLKASIEKLQSDNKIAMENYEKEIHSLRINSAIELALSKTKAKNITAVKALLKDIDKAELSKDGEIKGLNEQIEALKKSDGYLFETSGTVNFRGTTPANSADDEGGTDTTKMTYSQMIAYLANNPEAKIN